MRLVSSHINGAFDRPLTLQQGRVRVVIGAVPRIRIQIAQIFQMKFQQARSIRDVQ